MIDFAATSNGDRTRAHGKENPPIFYAVRYSYPTRVPNQRQLPTDHDCAVSTRGYQSDQPSHLPLALLPALHSSTAGSNLVRRQERLNRHLTRSLHIRNRTSARTGGR